MIIADTGPLVAAADANDQDHERCLAALLRAERIVVPSSVLAETCYLLERNLGSTAEAAFLRSFEAEELVLANITSGDLERMAELVEHYGDLPLGAVDASVVAVAERLKITEIATLDRRHFTIVRPRHVAAFTLIPD